MAIFLEIKKFRGKSESNGDDEDPFACHRPSISSIIAMLTNAIYNLVDTFFIGRICTSTVGAVSFAFPIFNLIGAVGLTYGVGAASYLSRLLGAGDKKQAD